VNEGKKHKKKATTSEEPKVPGNAGEPAFDDKKEQGKRCAENWKGFRRKKRGRKTRKEIKEKKEQQTARFKTAAWNAS